MEFPHQAAIVADVGQRASDQGDVLGKIGVTVAVDVQRTRVLSGQEAGTAGRADRALRVGTGEGDTLGDEPIQVGCADVLVAQGVNRVVSLLVCADPQDVGPCAAHRAAPWLYAASGVRVGEEDLGIASFRPVLVPTLRTCPRLQDFGLCLAIKRSIQKGRDQLGVK